MRAGPIRSLSPSLIIILLATVNSGCDKLARDDPALAGRVRAEVKREQVACGSPSAGDRLKNAIFDEAIARRDGDRGNLDMLADYSVSRLQDPVVMKWDRSLDVTHCKGRFILEVPPGAERAFGGEHQLQAKIDYTAQASADGAGFVYQQQGAEPIVARLAAFNLETGAYRPPPAIDNAQASAEGAKPASAAPTATPASTKPALPALATTPKPLQTVEARPVPTPRASEPGSTGSVASTPINGRSGNGEATVRAFYRALGTGNGAAAASQIVPEKRSGGPFSQAAISRFYGRLPEPLQLTGIMPAAGDTYRVTYRYSAGRSRCQGSAIVKLTNRGGQKFIRSIRALNGC